MSRAGLALASLALVLTGAVPVALADPPAESPSAKTLFETRNTIIDAGASGADVQTLPDPGGAPGSGAGRPGGPITRRPEPTGLKYRIKLMEDGGSYFVPNIRVFRSGERIQLLLTANVDAHLAILQVGADSSMELLYPDSELGLNENRVQAYKEVVFPGPKHGFRFVDKPGTERLLVVLAKRKHQLDELNLETRISSSEGRKLLDEAESLAGQKRLQIVEVARSETATYAVNIGGGYVLQEIRLKHQ